MVIMSKFSKMSCDIPTYVTIRYSDPCLHTIHHIKCCLHQLNCNSSKTVEQENISFTLGQKNNSCN